MKHSRHFYWKLQVEDVCISKPTDAQSVCTLGVIGRINQHFDFFDMFSTLFLNNMCSNTTYCCECCCQEVEYVVSVQIAKVISSRKSVHKTLYIYLQHHIHPGAIILSLI
ncbi:hypothetical protein GOODEAATRI_008248 [Goodea atripinnis]|uniref:Uncharacterized protein n=1 Tax=Goodea atripinnis TaxID=208336 RepID=A0ABV0NUF1_9TELE